MKYVIWGAGLRGERIFYHIGAADVVAFVDSDILKNGTYYLNKRVIGWDEYEKKYKEYPIIISFEGEKKGIDYLEDRNIKNYFLLSECPNEFQSPNLNNNLKNYVVNKILQGNQYAILGCTVYSIKVYDWIKAKSGKEPFLVIDSRMSHSICDVLKRNGYAYVFNESTRKANCEALCICVDTKVMKNKMQIEEKVDIHDFFDCSDYIEEYYNSNIEKFKNIHKGQKCFIVATGPSLQMEDLNILNENNIICFSMNHIYKAFQNTKWRPQYYMVTDYKMMRDYPEEVYDIDSDIAFLGDSYPAYWEKDNKKNHFKIHVVYETYTDKPIKFSETLERKSYSGYTVTYSCMQMAAYMGFKEIYLLGVDFSYAEEDSNVKYGHFFEEKMLHSLGYGKQVAMSYQAAKEYADAHGIKIYNATRGGKLEIFERVDFDTLF